jgi:hypothetical protein
MADLIEDIKKTALLGGKAAVVDQMVVISE